MNESHASKKIVSLFHSQDFRSFVVCKPYLQTAAMDAADSKAAADYEDVNVEDRMN